MDAHDGDDGVAAPEDSGPGFYRLGENQSNASIFEDVEMAHDEVRVICSALQSSGYRGEELLLTHALAAFFRPRG